MLGPGGLTLLHYACLGDNTAATLITHGLDVDARAWVGSLPAAAHVAAMYGQAHGLELLSAANAELRVPDISGLAPLDSALGGLPRSIECVRVLVANGVRLSTAHFHDRITPELEAFAQGVLRPLWRCLATEVSKFDDEIIEALNDAVGANKVIAWKMGTDGGLLHRQWHLSRGGL